MKYLILLLSLAASYSSLAQDHFDRSNTISTLFNGNWVSDELHKENIDINQQLARDIRGLETKSYTITKEGISRLVISKNNIGRIEFEAILINQNDSILFNHLKPRQGKLVVTPEKDHRKLEEKSVEFDFSQDIHQIIRLDISVAGVDKLEIKFESSSDQFILKSLQVFPLNEQGLSHIQAIDTYLEKTEVFKSELAEKKDKIKDQYTAQINRAIALSQNINELLSHNSGERMATVRANALNPFGSSAFHDHYNKILEVAHEEKQNEIKKTLDEVKDGNLGEIAMKLGKMAIGGPFSTLFSTLSGLFSTSFKWKDKGTIVNMGSKYFKAKEKRNGNFDLDPVLPGTEKAINKEKDNHEAFASFIKTIVDFAFADAETANELQAACSNARLILKDLELHAWHTTEPFTDKEQDDFFENDRLLLSNMNTEIREFFDGEKLDFDTFQRKEEHARASAQQLADIENKYTTVIKEIEALYMQLYVDNPKERKSAFDNTALPDGIIVDWIKNQDKIIETFNAENGSGDLLKKWKLD